MTHTPDSLLVQQALTGNKDAYCVLVRRYQNCAYAAALGVLSDMDLAGDVVQEAFLRAWLDLPKLREPGRFAGWLRGVVRHMALRALREIGRVQLLAAEMNDTLEVEAADPAPDASAEGKEQRQIVQKALNRLGDANREAIWLHYVEDMSYGQIASLLGISQTAVQGRLQRGRAELREEFKKMADILGAGRLADDFASQVHRLLDQVGKPGRPHLRVVEELAQMGLPAVEPLTQALEDVRVPVRVAAARALTRIGDVRALRPIIRLLYAPDSWRYCPLFEEGHILGIPGVREGLLEAMEAGDRGMAIGALGHAKGDEEVYQRLLRVFRDKNEHPSVARNAMDALCRIKPETAPDILVEALQSRQPRLRGWAARLALDMGILPPIEACMRALGGGVDMYDRYNAGRLILRHGQAGKHALERLVESHSPSERDSAALALAQAGDQNAIGLLRQQLQEGGLHRKWAKFISWVLRGVVSGQ